MTRRASWISPDLATPPRPDRGRSPTRRQTYIMTETLKPPCLNFEKEAEAAIGLSADWCSYAILPIGYPMGRFGPVRRVPLSGVVYENQWGRPYQA